MEDKAVGQLEDFFTRVWAVLCFEPKPNHVNRREAAEESGELSITVEVIRGGNIQRIKGLFSNSDVCRRAHIGLRSLLETAKIEIPAPH
jgi:hypothetical protein